MTGVSREQKYRVGFLSRENVTQFSVLPTFFHPYHWCSQFSCRCLQKTPTRASSWWMCSLTQAAFPNASFTIEPDTEHLNIIANDSLFPTVSMVLISYLTFKILHVIVPIYPSRLLPLPFKITCAPKLNYLHLIRSPSHSFITLCLSHLFQF